MIFLNTSKKKGAISLFTGIGILIISIIFLGLFIYFASNYFGSIEDSQRMNANQNNLILINSTLLELKDLGVGSYKEISLNLVDNITFDHVNNNIVILQEIKNQNSIEKLKSEFNIGQIKVSNKINSLEYTIDYNEILKFNFTFDTAGSFEKLRFSVVDIEDNIPVISVIRTLDFILVENVSYNHVTLSNNHPNKPLEITGYKIISDVINSSLLNNFISLKDPVLISIRESIDFNLFCFPENNFTVYFYTSDGDEFKTNIYTDTINLLGCLENPMTVSVFSPLNNSTFFLGEEISFTAIIENPEGGHTCSWTSSLDENIITSYVFAEGGEVTDVEMDGVWYRVHAFKDVGEDTFTVHNPGKVDVLVVAGGGGGGSAFNNTSRYGGGGGAGGLIFQENLFVTQNTNINVVVGAGGRGSGYLQGIPYRIAGENGKNSSFNDLVAIGGGGGSSSSSEDDGRDPAGSGGSGGGGGGGEVSQGEGGVGILEQGHDGADGTVDYSGGGGGANGFGDGVSGGAGKTIWGVTYASGGSGKTGVFSHGEDANDNTGDGGGGSSGSIDNFGFGGDGGSGIVLVRYEIPYENYVSEIFNSCDINYSNLSLGDHVITLKVTDNIQTIVKNINVNIKEYPQGYLDYLSLVESDGGELINEKETIKIFEFLVDNNLYNNLVLGISGRTGIKTRISGEDLFVEKAYDFSGNNNHAIQITTSNQPIFIDNEIKFMGGGDLLNAGNDESLRLSNNFTVSTWIKTTQKSSSNQYFLARYSTGDNKRVWGFILRGNQNYASLIASSTGANASVSNGTLEINEGTWKHVAFTHENGTVKMYVDGVLDVTRSNHSNLFDTDTDLLISRSNSFVGSLNDIFVFNKVLSEEEINSLYSVTKEKHIIYNYEKYVSLVESDGGEIIDEEETLSLFEFLIDNNLYNNLVLGISSSTGVKTRSSGSDLFVEKAYDFSGNNNHAVQSTTTSQPLLKDLGVEFDAASEKWLSILNNNLNIYDEISVLVWSKPYTWDSKYRTIITQGSRFNSFTLRHSRSISNNNIIRFRVDTNTGTYSAGHSPVDPIGFDNKWYFYNSVYDKNSLKFYLNKNLEEENTYINGSLFGVDKNIFIGRIDPLDTDEFWHGKIDKIFIFNRALSQEEIITLYNYTKDKYIQETYDEYVSLVESDGGEIIDEEETLSLFEFLIDNNLYNNLVLGISSSTGVKTRSSGSDLFVEKAYDFSGNNNHAVQSTTTAQPLLKDLGVEFNGIEDHINIPNSLGLYDSNFTVGFWYNHFVTSGDKYLFVLYGDISGRFTTQSSNNVINFRGENPSWNNILTAPAHNSEEWYYILVTYDDIEGYKMYQNGILIDNNEITTKLNSRNETNIIGTYSNQFFPGKINDVIIFNKSLFSEEITALYNYTKDKYGH